MAIKRPKLTEESFLRHIFSPKKNPLPVGLRARPLVAGKGRNKGRVASYNRMSASSQEILKRSGLREAYLKGDISLSAAKSALREKAVERGIAKPLRAKKSQEVRSRRASLDAFIASRIVQKISSRKPDFNARNLAKRLVHLPEKDQIKARTWEIEDIVRYAADPENVITVDGQTFNPLWYN